MSVDRQTENSCYGAPVLVGRSDQTNAKKTAREDSLLHAFPGSVRVLAFIVSVLAGGGSNFGSLDFDELSSPDFGIEQGALPATTEATESVLLQKKAPMPCRTESPVLSRHGLTIMRGAPQSLQNFCCWYEHIPERGPPLLL